MHQPPMPSQVAAQDHPFSFVPAYATHDSPPLTLEMWTHDASVSLPSSSGGLDALLNTPRTTSQLWDHRKPDVSNLSGVHAEKVDDVGSSPLLVCHAGVDRTPGVHRTPKQVTESFTPYLRITPTPFELEIFKLISAGNCLFVDPTPTHQRHNGVHGNSDSSATKEGPYRRGTRSEGRFAWQVYQVEGHVTDEWTER